ncbi:MAG: HEAT repeat domain-containing protein [Candidatus Odinarchaeota archaeon]
MYSLKIMNLTPEIIFEDLKHNRINKKTAYDLLISLVENSENENVRLNAIINLEKIGLINKDLFNFLEDLLISDSNSIIRFAAIKFLKHKFLQKAINPFKWAINHETNYECLIKIIQTLDKINSYESKLILINQIKKIIKIKFLSKERRIENKKFRIVLKKFIKSKKVMDFTHRELAEVLINYLTINNLINQFPNVYYEINLQNGLIEELDLSDYLEYEVKGTPFGWKNNIQSISQIMGLKYLKSLNKIDLSNNNIENVKEVVQLKELTHLILTNNKICEIENLNYIKCLPRLEYLDLRGNELGKRISLDEFDPKIRVLLKETYL